MASNMDTKHGDKGETEHDKTTAAISEADSGRGLSVADVSSPEGDDQRRVGTNQDLDEIEPRMPIQTDTLQDSQAAVGKEPYDRELQLQEGERDELYDGDSPETTSKRIVQPSEQGEDAFAKWQSAYGRHDNVFQLLIVDPVSGKWRKLQLRDVCVNRVDQKGSGHVSVDVTGLEVRDANKTNGNIVAGNEQRDVLRDLQDLSLSESVVLSYRRGSDVSPHLLQEVKERGAGKSPHVQEFFSFIAKHLASFGEVEDCYILPLRNGLLISQSELTVRSIQGTKLTVAQTTVRGTIILLNPTVSQDMKATYRPDHESSTTPGNFETRKRLGRGAEGPVYNAADIESNDEFAFKKIPLAKFGSYKEAAAAFLELKGSTNTCRPYGLVLDEENDCVLFLMERVRGRTLREVLKDQTELMEVPVAVGYATGILTGLKYIQSQEMMHTDVAARNVIIDGLHAILIDLTGAKKMKLKGWDEAGALCLLNGMLRNEIPQKIHLDESSNLWKATADDLAKFNPATLWKLEELLEKVAKTPTTQTPTVDELLPILQEISEGLPKTSDTVDSQDSLEDGVPSPPNIQLSPEGSAQVETLEGLKKQIEELTEENEKYRKDLSDAEKKLKEEENRLLFLCKLLKGRYNVYVMARQTSFHH
ncbi:uncharacterized protein LOC118409886 isoform X2 [Branchiostoma floridae]|uniref:Uncharacterized protein LOC118409886 isoform X2 n=1 Tax=Branchiostoma floridae TaxID=7739 RepID=A0A9J7KNE0_BRAFL|nr:uncharacterized protein LOC118409886 isoform X2 [Branchiostoma floridae]